MTTLYEALKDRDTKDLLKKFAPMAVNTLTIGFFESPIGQANSVTKKQMYDEYIKDHEVDVKVDAKVRERLDERYNNKDFAGMTVDLTAAQQSVRDQMQLALNDLEKALKAVRTANEKNVKSSKDGDALKAALVGKVLVIGSTQDLYAGHSPKLKTWLFSSPEATPEIQGKLTVKKGTLTSKGSLTISSSLSAHKTVIGKEILGFSKKKLLDPKK